MKRIELLQFLAEQILRIEKDSPVLVAIDGVDASGKTTLANELADYFHDLNQKIIRASIDGFHNPAEVRYAKGKDSPEGYYYDSFNYARVMNTLLNPLTTGNLEYTTEDFDYRTDSKVVLPTKTAMKDSILIMDGIFLFRPNLIGYWDLKIFLDVDFKFTLQRNLLRQADKDHLGSEENIIDKYNRRYMPGQKLYFEEANPKGNADIVIDNTKFEAPLIIRSCVL